MTTSLPYKTIFFIQNGGLSVTTPKILSEQKVDIEWGLGHVVEACARDPTSNMQGTHFSSRITLGTNIRFGPLETPLCKHFFRFPSFQLFANR